MLRDRQAQGTLFVSTKLAEPVDREAFPWGKPTCSTSKQEERATSTPHASLWAGAQ